MMYTDAWILGLAMNDLQHRSLYPKTADKQLTTNMCKAPHSYQTHNA